MIIRITFNDNDFTHVIQQFLDKRRADVFSYDIASYIARCGLQNNRFDLSEAWRQRSSIIDKQRYNKHDVATLLNIFTISFNEYIYTLFNDSDNFHYLIDNLDISVVSSVTDSPTNNCVVYYFVKSDNYVTM